jgi:hypothetical protein
VQLIIKLIHFSDQVGWDRVSREARLQSFQLLLQLFD